MSTSAFTFRPCQPGDEQAITKLFELTFGKPMSLDFWRWRFTQHPSGGPLVMLGFAGDELVSHYAASQAPLSVAGEVIPAGLSMTTMTHPAYRGRGLFEKTAKALYEILPAKDIRAVYGFPNNNVHQLRISKLNWCDSYEVPTLALDMTALSQAPQADAVVHEAPTIDARFETFFNAIAPSLPLAGARSEAILSWRLDRNPENKYTRLVLDAGDAIAGYAITKTYGDDATDLVELRAADNAGARALVNTAIARAAAAGHKRLSTWCLPGEMHRAALEFAGFKAAAPVTYLGARAFGTLPADLSDGRLWRISMLDSDLY